MLNDILFLTGCEDFATIIEKNAYYVDKTRYLKTLFMSSNEVMNPLFIRPRRFGKTLNLSMIREFCELNYQNPGDKSRQHKLFLDNGRHLAVAGDEYHELRNKIMGEFPVINISFKTVEGSTFTDAVAQLLYKIGMLYDKFSFLINSSKQEPDDIKNFRTNKEFSRTMQANVDEPKYLNMAIKIIVRAIPQIGEMLYREYQRQVIVIIDEYDVPLQKAVVAREPYYEDMLDIIRTLCGNTFKQDNLPWLYKGIVSGCLRIAHQSIFTDANNFTTYGMSREPYTGFFGFTWEESRQLLDDCGLSDQDKKVKEWYDGYRFGNLHVYCPWSLVNYCDEAKNDRNIEPEPFWVNTSGNDLINLYIKNSMEAHDAGNMDRLQQLLDGRSVEISIKEFTTYPDITHRVGFDVFMTLMLHTGYVTYAEDSGFLNQVKVRIPNREVYECFKAKQELLYSEDNPYWFNHALKLVDLLMEDRHEEAGEILNSMLMGFLSVRNYGDELYYHGFVQGIIGLAASTRNLTVQEELESGLGYTDIVIINHATRTVCILELKKADNSDDCYEAAQKAAKQIVDKKYAAKFIENHARKVFGIGIGFARKSCEIVSLGNLVMNTSDNP